MPGPEYKNRNTIHLNYITRVNLSFFFELFVILKFFKQCIKNGVSIAFFKYFVSDFGNFRIVFSYIFYIQIEVCLLNQIIMMCLKGTVSALSSGLSNKEGILRLTTIP